MDVVLIVVKLRSLGLDLSAAFGLLFELVINEMNAYLRLLDI